MSARILTSTTGRILRQLRHDRRTIALIVVMPVLLLTLMFYMFEGQEQTFHRVGLIMLGMFPLIIMFLLTSIAVLRERTSGTLERLFTTPMGKLDLLFAYGIAFGIAATIQGLIAAGFASWVLDLETAGSLALVILIAVANAVLGVALGLLCSAFAQTEFQAVQFLPAVLLPQVLLCGLFVARDQMAGWMEGLSNVMPMSYSVSALLEVGANAEATSTMWRDLGVVMGVVVIALALGAATLRRRTP
jgi:ABC-2 type transport system permease protein